MIMTRTCPLWLLTLALVLIHVTHASAEPATSSAALATLQLTNGDCVAGQLGDCDKAGIVRWQGSAFVTPLDFAVSAVSAVRFPAPPERPRPSGEYRFELQGGDMLFGSLLGLSAQDCELEVARLGRLRVQRTAIRRVSRWREGDGLVYLGPNSLSEWTEASPDGAWRQDGGHLVTERKGACLARNFDLPAQVSIEVELSWTGQPEFVLVLGTGRETSEHAPRFEVWDRDLVFLCETEEGADLASVQAITAGEGRCHFLVCLDQQRNQATVFSADGRRLADVKTGFRRSPTRKTGGLLPVLQQALVAPTSTKAEPSAKPGIRLTNHRGSLRVEQLRIMRWDGQPPRDVPPDQSRLHRADGSSVSGAVQGFDARASEFLIAENDRVTRIRADDVGSIELSAPGKVPPRDIRAVLHDGTRLSGKLGKVAGGRLWLECSGVAEPVSVPVSELQTLVALESSQTPSSVQGRVGRLEMENLKLHGCLLDANNGPGANCLVWQPQGSTTASPLKRGIPGRIVYRDPPPPAPVPQATRTRVLQVQPAQGGGFLGQFVRVLVGNGPGTASPPQPPRPVPSLYLRTGDAIPCQVKQIDERGVTFQSSVFDATFVPHDKIRAVELENPSSDTKINKAKRDRLLTLPRMQKDDPPTHLIRSTKGDYLRARLIEMDDKTLAVEVRAETRRLPRESVTRIIWLHHEESGGDALKANGEDASTATRVQAVRDNGIRLTFLPEKLNSATLCGTSDVLGACRVALADIDQLILGSAIEQAATGLPYQRWKLQQAIEPKFAGGDGEQGGRPGEESALVGKPAPDFELATLDGQRFRLSGQRGKVVVLDFWATWCGPCIQTLPQIVRVAKECEDQNVLLVAVNLQETPEAITKALERLKLKMTVALDSDGVVAQQYAAVAIPQTVIIDSAGNVAGLFVGGGPQYGDQVRDALRSVLGPAKK